MSDLTVKIKGDASGFQKEWAKVQGTVANTLTGGGMGLSSMVGGVLGGLTIGSVISEIKSLVDELDNIGDSAKMYHLLPKEFQVISYAAKKVGADANDVGMAFKKMNGMIYDATQGSQQAGATLYYLGLNAEKLSKMTMDEKMKAVAEALDKQENATVRDALAQDMLGKSYQRVMQVMKELPSAMKEAEKFGFLQDDKSIQTAENIADAYLRLSLVLKRGIVDTGVLNDVQKLTSALENLSLAFNKLQGSADIIGKAKGVYNTLVDNAVPGKKLISMGIDYFSSVQNASNIQTGSTGYNPVNAPSTPIEAVMQQIYQVLNSRLPGGTSTAEVVK